MCGNGEVCGGGQQQREGVVEAAAAAAEDEVAEVVEVFADTVAAAEPTVVMAGKGESGGCGVAEILFCSTMGVV